MNQLLSRVLFVFVVDGIFVIPNMTGSYLERPGADMRRLHVHQMPAMLDCSSRVDTPMRPQVLHSVPES